MAYLGKHPSPFTAAIFSLIKLTSRVEYPLDDDNKTRPRSLHLPTALTAAKGIVNDQNFGRRT